MDDNAFKQMKGFFFSDELIDGDFSILFPKTWAFVDDLRKTKYRDLGFTPDVKVIVFRKRSFIVRKLNEKKTSLAMFNTVSMNIEIYLENLFLIQGASADSDYAKKITTNSLLCCKYIDTINPLKEILIHEYQHYLQHYIYLATQTESMPHRLPSVIIESAKKALKNSNAVLLLKEASQNLNISESKITDTYKTRARYIFNPLEIESFIAQEVFRAVNGLHLHSGNSYVLDRFLGQDLDNLKKRIEALDAHISELKRMSTTKMNESQAKEVSKQMQICSAALTANRGCLELIPLIESEVRRIASQIVELQVKSNKLK